jgi:hypothetical protein
MEKKLVYLSTEKIGSHIIALGETSLDDIFQKCI